jgi:ketosteroid isomerase-like protein
MSQESVTAVREILDAANRRDYEVALAAIHPEVQWHSPPDIPNPEVARGRDEYVAMWRDWLDAWDDYRFTPDEIWEAPGETVIVSGVESARGRDSGIDVLSRRITGVYEVRDRKIVHFKAYLDRHEALEAAGVRE